MTPPPAVAEALERMRYSSGHPPCPPMGCRHCADLALIRDHIQAGAGPGGERARAIEECMKVVCQDCRAGRPAALEEDGWEHRFDDGSSFLCRAEKLRALLRTPVPATETTQ